MVFFLQNTSYIRKPQVISGGAGVRTPGTLPPRSALENYYCSLFTTKMNQHELQRAAR